MIKYKIFINSILLITHCCLLPILSVSQSDEVPAISVGQVTFSMLEVQNLINGRKFEEALELINQLKPVINEAYGKGSFLASNIWKQLGTVYFYQQNYRESIKALDSCVVVMEKIVGPNNIFMVQPLNNLAAALREVGAYERSINCLMRALAIDTTMNLDKRNLYSNLGNNYNNLGNISQALYYYKLSLEVSSKYPSEITAKADDYNNIGTVYRIMGDYDTALNYFRQALELYEENARKSNISKQITTLGNLGGLLSDIGDNYGAKSMHEKALAISISHFGKEDHLSIAVCYNNLGLDCLNIGDYKRAIEYFQRALLYFQKNLPLGHPNIATAYANLGDSYSYIENYDLAISTIDKGLKIRALNDPNTPSNEINGYNNLAHIYVRMGQFDLAIEYFKRALENQIRLLGEEHPTTITLYNGLGNVYQAINDRKKAALYHQKALDIANNTLTKLHPTRGNVLSAMAENMVQQGFFNEAEQTFFESLKACNYRDTLSLEQVSSIPTLLYALHRMGVHYQKRAVATADSAFLHKARSCFAQAIATLDYHSQSISPASKSTLAAKAGEILSDAIVTNNLLHHETRRQEYLHEAFRFSERAKAFLLYQAMQEAEALQIAGIPDSLIKKEYNLRVDIAHWDKKRQELLSKGFLETDSIVLATIAKLGDLNQINEGLKQTFETKYSDYFRAKYDKSTIPVSEIQQNLLEPDQTLIEYAVGDSSIFIFVVQKEHFDMLKIQRDPNLDTLVRKLTREGLYGFHVNGADQISEQEAATNYTDAAFRLYQILLAPVKRAFSLTKRLLIIPDGILGYIPFETLLTQKPGRLGAFASYPYLLHEHQISYNYSATLLREMNKKTSRVKAPSDLLAMAPFYFGDARKLKPSVDSLDLFFETQRDGLDPLNYSGQEVLDITTIWKKQSKPLYGKEASMQQFLQLAGDYRILHLSTHGEADERMGDYAYLAFSQPSQNDFFDKLYARDLYNLRLNAELVVLSACETGTGKLQRGEGIISLARAFAYAGAESILTTLWKVKDSQTREIMVSFYRQLKLGKSKDIALWVAKSTYLKKRKGRDDSGAHPFYWASFIPIGVMTALR